MAKFNVGENIRKMKLIIMIIMLLFVAVTNEDEGNLYFRVLQYEIKY